jgi:hypothetical protein
MDNGAILNTNGNELNTFENLRTSNENIRQQAANPRTRPANETPGTQNQNDLVELSRESIDLAGLVENADLAAARLAEPRYVEETLLEPANTDLLTGGGSGTEINGLAGANPENPTNVAEIETRVLAVENETAITANATNTINTATEAEVTTELEAAAATPATPTTPENIAAETATAAGPPATITETEPPPETQPVQGETAVALEEQASRLTQINNALNTTNGLTVTASNPETNTPDEVARNERQILLQQVGSQLAQVIPPASVFSVVAPDLHSRRAEV